MFALIPVVISIVLMAILAIGSMFYGGSMFTESASNANAASLINQAQQIGSASMMFQLDNGGERPDNIAELISENYLQGSPVPPSVSTTATLVWALHATLNIVELDGIESVAVCNLVNEKAGVTTTDGGAAAIADITIVPYGCIAGATDLKFQFRF